MAQEETGRDGGDEGVEERRAGADGHEGVHVGRAPLTLAHGAHVDVPARPGHHDDGKNQEDPGAGAGVDAVEPGQGALEDRRGRSITPAHEGVDGDPVVAAMGGHEGHREDHRDAARDQAEGGLPPEVGGLAALRRPRASPAPRTGSPGSRGARPRTRYAGSPRRARRETSPAGSYATAALPSMRLTEALRTPGVQPRGPSGCWPDRPRTSSLRRGCVTVLVLMPASGASAV